MTTDDPNVSSWDTGGHCLGCVVEIERTFERQMEDIDWSNCPLVTRDPNFYSGVPALRDHPRLPVEALINNHLDGETIETIAYMFEVDAEQVRAIVQYYRERVA